MNSSMISTARAFFILVTGFFLNSGQLCGQKTATNLNLDSLQESEIDIPIQVNLIPIFALAEKKVDTVFTSPNYPADWVQSDCSTRYKYHFRRSPLKMSVSGTTLNLSFMGYYQIVGSTRVCVGGTVLSPWTPPCRCGFDELERRVNIGFSSSFKLLPNYTLTTKIIRSEPGALDKCSVCFWGQDITTAVMNGLKADLDASRKSLEDSFSVINLRPYIQQLWNKMNDEYAVPGLGFFSLHPKRLRMENIDAKNNLLNINIGITAAPSVSFEKGAHVSSIVPDLTSSIHPGGFNIYLEAALHYDSLSSIVNAYMLNKRFDMSQGFIKNYIIIERTSVSGTAEGKMMITVDFKGSFDGTAYFTGKPVYNAEKKLIEIEHLDYDLRTKNLLLKTARWLFGSKIISELKKYTSFDLSAYYDSGTKTLNSWINREWTKGITGAGAVNELKLIGVFARPEHLMIRSNCSGRLNININEINLFGTR